MSQDDIFEPAPAAAPGASRRTILVVDDEEMMRDLLSRILERAGYAVAAASDGDDGLQRFRKGGIDVVVTDMMMPVMDGLQLIEALTAESPEVRVIALSGVESRTRFLKRARELGAQATLLKPVGRADLVKTLERILG